MLAHMDPQNNVTSFKNISRVVCALLQLLFRSLSILGYVLIVEHTSFCRNKMVVTSVAFLKCMKNVCGLSIPLVIDKRICGNIRLNVLKLTVVLLKCC